MVQIFNLKSTGEKRYGETIKELKNYVQLINSQYNINRRLNLVIEQESHDFIKIENENANFILSFVFDFDVQFDKSIIKIENNKNKMVQKILLSDKNSEWNDDIDLIVNLQNDDIEEFLLDYFSIFEANTFPNNFDIEDLFQFTKNKKLSYNRTNITDNSIDKIFNTHLNKKSPLLYYLKTNNSLDDSIKLIVKIEELCGSDTITTDRVWCILNRNANELSTLTEI